MNNKYAIAFFACNKNADKFREDASFIYRCENPGLALKAAGHSVQLMHLSQLEKGHKFDLAVVYRPRSSWRLSGNLKRLKKQSNLLIADVDDLILHPDHAHFSPAFLNKNLSLKKIRQQFNDNFKALSCFDHISVSTQPLADMVAFYFPDVHPILMSNCVHYNWLQQPLGLGVADMRPKLTYFPGTRSHERDFQLIRPVLSEFLHQYPEVQLDITGYLEASLNARTDQVVRSAKLPFSEYVERVQKGWINLCPLESGPFNSCKSALKVIESGFFGAPTLCSFLPDADRFSPDVATLCRNPEEWFKTLQTGLHRVQSDLVRQSRRSKVLAQADIRVVSKKLTDLLAG